MEPHLSHNGELEYGKEITEHRKGVSLVPRDTMGAEESVKGESRETRGDVIPIASAEANSTDRSVGESVLTKVNAAEKEKEQAPCKETTTAENVDIASTGSTDYEPVNEIQKERAKDREDLVQEEQPHCKRQRLESSSILEENEVVSAAHEESEQTPSKVSANEKVENRISGMPFDKAPKQKQKKSIRSKHVEKEVLVIRKKIQDGCKNNDLASAIEAYEEAISNHIRLEAQSFYNLLNLCDGLERAVHIGTPKSSATDTEARPACEVRAVNLKTRQEYVFRIKEHMRTLNLPLNETAYSAIVKILSRNKEFERAEEILAEAESVQQCRPKLRLFSSLLIAYCDEGKMLEALKCWKRLKRKGLEISEKERLALMRCAIYTGDILVMEQILTDLAEDVPVPSKDSVAAILEWFQSAHAMHSSEEIGKVVSKHANDAEVEKLLEEIHEQEIEVPPKMGPVINTNGWEVSSTCPIDPQTGVLQISSSRGCKLKMVHLSERAWDEMISKNEEIVVSGQVEGNTCQYQGGKKGKKRTNFSPEKRQAEWKRFCDFLLKKGPLDVLIDGANVGFFKQNFASAPKHVDYEQIDWVVQHFTDSGKRVLLVLHERHFGDIMPPKYRNLEEKWVKSGVLYKTPRGMNDDWFWLHAALKYKSLVLTNDEMRDHHFQMLAPRIFLRWKERHQIHFGFGAWTDVGGQRQRQVELIYPEPYSRRIQRVEDCIIVPLAKRGDENRFLDGLHVACDDEPVEETYVCLKPVEAKSNGILSVNA